VIGVVPFHTVLDDNDGGKLVYMSLVEMLDISDTFSKRNALRSSERPSWCLYGALKFDFHRSKYFSVASRATI
jgi:hypothetical protein